MKLSFLKKNEGVVFLKGYNTKNSASLFGLDSNLKRRDKASRTRGMERLSRVARLSAIVRAALTIRSRLPFKQGFKLECDDAKALGLCENLSRNSQLDYLCRKLQYNVDVYGMACLEKLFYTKNDDPAREDSANLAVILPWQIDYKRTLTGEILYDGTRPNGFLYQQDYDKSVFLDWSRVACHVNNPSGGYEPDSMVEACHNLAEYVENNNKNMAKWMNRNAMPTLNAEVGSPESPPDQEKFDEVKSELEDLDTSSDILVHSYMVKLSEIKAGTVRDIIHINDPFIYQLTAITGIPKPFLLGAAEGTELATSRAQVTILLDTMEDLQYLMGRFIENQIYRPFCELHGLVEWPRIRWTPIDTRDVLDIANTVRTLVGKGTEPPIITISEARELVNKHLVLEEWNPSQPKPSPDTARGAGDAAQTSSPELNATKTLQSHTETTGIYPGEEMTDATSSRYTATAYAGTSKLKTTEGVVARSTKTGRKSAETTPTSLKRRSRAAGTR